MEFFLGSVFTLILFTVMRQIILKLDLDNRYKVPYIMYTQSHIDRLVGQRVSYLFYPQELPNTQSRSFRPKSEIRVVLSDTHAYWIRDSKLYQANLVDGKIDDSTKKLVDTMTMDKVELDKMFFIVQKLTEGRGHDSGNTGVEGF